MFHEVLNKRFHKVVKIFMNGVLNNKQIFSQKELKEAPRKFFFSNTQNDWKPLV
jgi:hypothetical protein